MNKFFKYTFIALLGVLTLGLSSCTDEYEYTPTSKTELGGNAFLVSEGSTAKSFLPEAEQSFTFKVSRIDSTEAQTVGLSSSNDKFTVPATVSFAAGQGTAEVKVNFDIAAGTSEKPRIAITDAEKYYYAATVLDYSITRYLAYSGTYVADPGFLGFEIQTPCYKIGAGKFMVPADPENGYEYDIVFSIDKDNNVIVAPQPAWNHPKYGAVYVMGNAEGDAVADGSGSGVAGTYDPETGVVSMAMFHFIPNTGSFGTKDDVFVFNEKPAL